MGSLQSSTLTWGNSWSSSPLLGTPLLPALTLSSVKNARLEQLPLLTVCCLMQALLSREKSRKLLSAPRLRTQQAVRQLLICGLVTWLPVSTTTLFLKLMSAPVLVSARKPPSSPPVTGLVRSAPTSLQELLTTWLLKTIVEGVEYLQGECFCGQDGHTDDCGALVSTIVPLAMPVLAGVLVDQTTELCQEVVGVCQTSNKDLVL